METSKKVKDAHAIEENSVSEAIQNETLTNNKPKNKESEISVVSILFKVYGSKILYTIGFGASIYFLILIGSIITPFLLSNIIVNLGYDLNSASGIYLASACGLFFILCLFAVFIFILSRLYKFFSKVMKRKFSDEELEKRINEVYDE